MLEKNNAVVTLPKGITKMSLKKLASQDPEIREFILAIKETGLREKAVEFLNREIRLKMSH